MNSNTEKLDLTELPEAVKEHINQLERVRSDFVANVSHELRTPLTVLRGYLETFMQKEDVKAYKTIFEQMYQHSVRMENIIDELLLLSRLESEETSQEQQSDLNIPIMLETLAEDARRFSGVKQHIITLQAEPNLHMQGTEGELKSLFSNLIINAVKYTPEHGNIAIQWFEKDNVIVFAVTDTGIGIAEEHIPRLTERFYRVDKARSRESGGTGLGLAIAKHVLMRHHGELSIESEPGKGSTFTCRFPKAVIKSS